MRDTWGADARRGAAHAWGARHYRWYAAAAYWRMISGVAGALLAAGGVFAGGWWAMRSVGAVPALLLAAAACWLPAIGLVSWSLAAPRRSPSRAIVALLLLGAAAVAVAVAVS